MLNKFRRRLVEWNVFISDDQQYTLDNDHCQETNTNSDPRLLQQQRIATRVYIVFLITSLLILVTCTLLSWQTKVVTIHNPSLKIYQELQKKHPTILNCPCATNTMPYKDFITTKTAMHQICSSDFISQEWISALYIPDASRYSAIDFRTTANAQFKLLEILCRLARDNIFDALLNLNNAQLLTSSALPENEIFIKTNITGERIRIDTLARLNTALKLIESLIRDNHITSGLNTNLVYVAKISPLFSNFMYMFSYTQWYWTVNNETMICVCQRDTCSLPAGFYSFADINSYVIHTEIIPQEYNAPLAPGFVGSCTPLEAVLQAKFICLYNIKCVERLVRYFPRLAQLMPTIKILNASIRSKYPRNVIVNRLVKELFLEQWTISIDYNQYYTKCAPKMCTYSYAKRADFAYMITMLISLYGGLQTILRFFIPLIVKYIMKKRSDIIDNVTTDKMIQTSIQRRIAERLIIYFGIFKKSLINWNIFKSTDRSPEAIHHQRLSTRLYLCLLIGSVFILLLLTTISEQTNSVTYHHPSFIDYKQHYMKYSDKLICDCSEITPNYASFVNITPIYHPICSSAFIQQIWFDQLGLEKGTLVEMSDWRIASLGYFQSLATLCKLAHDTISNDLQAFGAATIVTTQLLNEPLLGSEINDTLKGLIRSIQTEFERVNNIFRLILQVNQYFAESTYNGQLNITYQFNEGRIKVKMLFDRPSYVFRESKCSCAVQADCEEPMVIFQGAKEIVVPGFVYRCTAMDSVLYSTLECLYSNTNCLKNILFRYMKYTTTVVPVPPLNASQLIRTSTNSTVATLADNLFVEEWKTSYSYLKYFETCAPSICQYTYIKRANYLYVITMFLAIYGGITLGLGLLVPLIVQLFLRCRHQSVSTDNQNIERISRIARFRAFYQWLSETTKAKITDFNLFHKYSFGKNIDQITKMRLGRLTTRLYICLYVIGIIILVLYTSIEQRTLTIKLYNPSPLVAQQLQTKYIGTVECPCKEASIPLEEFVSIQIRFHPICTSTFVKKKWREALIINLNNMSYFSSINDYRLFISAHLQLLSGLCHYAIKHVNDTIRSFTSTSLFTSRLLSKASFDKQLSDLLHQTETHVPTVFARALELVQAINYGNALMSVYESNYQFIGRKIEKDYSSVLYTLPMTYYGSTNCSCGLQSQCFVQAAFTWPHYMAVKGLLIGCLPSESFLASTLECFYDADCINLIRNNTPGDFNRTYADPLNVLNMKSSRFEINTTVNELVTKLFMEKWSNKIFYDRYFAQCAPNICSYSYIDNANPLYVATTLLGLYGGLTVVLSWWCPQLVKLVRRIHIHYKKKRQIRVEHSTT